MFFTRKIRQLRNVSKSKKTTPVSLFSSKFLLTRSTRRDSCSVVLGLRRKPNCPLRSNPTAIGYFTYQLCQAHCFVDRTEAVWSAFLVSAWISREHTSILPGNIVYGKQRCTLAREWLPPTWVEVPGPRSILLFSLVS